MYVRQKLILKTRTLWKNIPLLWLGTPLDFCRKLSLMLSMRTVVLTESRERLQSVKFMLVNEFVNDTSGNSGH